MVFQIHAYRLVPERQYLVRQLSTFQANQSVGQCVDLFFLYILADDLYQIRQRHHGTAYHEIEKLLFLLAPAMAEGYVLQPDRLGHGLSHLDFFPDTVYQMKWVSGNKIAKGMPGKPPPVPRSITEEPGLKRSISVIPSE